MQKETQNLIDVAKANETNLQWHTPTLTYFDAEDAELNGANTADGPGSSSNS